MEATRPELKGRAEEASLFKLRNAPLDSFSRDSQRKVSYGERALNTALSAARPPFLALPTLASLSPWLALSYPLQVLLCLLTCLTLPALIIPACLSLCLALCSLFLILICLPICPSPSLPYYLLYKTMPHSSTLCLTPSACFPATLTPSLPTIYHPASL